MKLSAEDARNVVYDYSELWEPVHWTRVIVDQTRWSVIKEGVFKHLESGKHYKFTWSQGATECQDERAYEYEKEYEPVEVELKEVMVKVWVEVK